MNEEKFDIRAEIKKCTEKIFKETGTVVTEINVDWALSKDYNGVMDKASAQEIKFTAWC